MTTAVKTTPPLGKVLVTGGCGFLGSHIVELLLKRYSSSTSSTSVHVLDLHVSRNTYSGVQYHACDITSPEAVRSILGTVKPDVVIHTASPVFTSGTKKSLEIMKKVNVDGTLNLIEKCKEIGGVRALVYTSSAGVVSDQRTDLINADERWLVIRGEIQREYYSETKATAEEKVLAANTQPDASTASNPSTTLPELRPLLTCAIRPSAMFGERDVQVFPGALGAYHRNQTGFQLGNNGNLFDFTYAGNVAHAHLLAAARLFEAWESYSKQPAKSLDEKKAEEKRKQAAQEEEPDKVDGEAFIISNGSPVYFWDFTRALWQSYHDQAGDSAPATAPTPVKKVWTLSFELAMAVAYLMSWVFWLLRLGEPKVDPATVRYTCMTRYFRIAKAQALLGYTPIVDLQDSVQRTARWFVEKDREEAGKKDR